MHPHNITMITTLSCAKKLLLLAAVFLVLILFTGTRINSATLPSAPPNSAQDTSGSKPQIHPRQKSRPANPAQPLSLAQSTNDGWNGSWLSAAPSLLGFDSISLEMAVEQIGRMDGIYSVIVVRNGVLVAERYFREASRTKPHNLKSASKSILSALIGIAIDKKLLGLDQPITDFIPLDADDTANKKKITVRHLLAMTSGLQSTSYQQYNSWIADGNWVKNAIKQPLTSPPGTLFQYSTGNTHLLSALLTKAAGKSTLDFAVEHLFSPLGITTWDWATDPQGINQGGNNLSLFPRDMARIGQLYLDNGSFGGQQMIPKWWIEESTKPGHPSDNKVYGDYGFLWYTHPGGRDAFTAVGFGGQYIYVSRPEECVIVVTSTLTSKGLDWEKQLFDLFHNKILKALHPEGKPLLKTSLLDNPAHTSEVSSQQASLLAETITRLNLRQEPDKKTPAVTTLEAGEILRIIKQNGAWFQVRAKGHEGWVLADYIRIISSETSTSARLAAEVKPAANTQEKSPSDARTALQETERRAARLQDLLQVSEAKWDQTNSNLIQLEEKWRNQEKVVAGGKITLRNMELEREGLRNLVASLESSLQEKKNAEAGLLNTIAELEKKIDQGEKGLADGRKKLTEQLKEANLKIQDATLQHSELIAHFEKSEAAKNTLARELKTVKAEAESTRKSQQKIEQELTAAKETLNKELVAQQQAAELEAKNRTTAELELTKLRAQIVEKQSSLASKEEAAVALQTSLAALTEKITAQEKLTAQVQEDKKKLIGEKQAITQQHSELIGHFEKSEAAKNTLTRELETAKAEAEGARKSQQKIEQELTAAKDSLTKELVAQKQAAELETKNRTAAELELTKLRTQIVEKQNLLASKEEAAAALQASVATLTEKIAAQEKLTAQVQEDKKKLTTEKDSEKGLRLGLQKKLETLEAENKNIAADRDGNKHKLIAMQLQVDKEKNTRKDTEQELVVLSSRIAALEEQLKNLNTENLANSATRTSTKQTIASLQKALAEEKAARTTAEQEQAALHSELIALRQTTLPEKITSPARSTSLAKTELAQHPVKTQTPSALPTGKKTPEQPDPDYDAIHSFVTSWAARWSEQNVAGYLASYSFSFLSADGLHYTDWVAQRKKRLARPSKISIQLDRIATEKTGQELARVSFDQNYRSDVYSDHVRKTLDLQWEKDQWKIVRETSTTIQ